VCLCFLYVFSLAALLGVINDDDDDDDDDRPAITGLVSDRQNSAS